MRVVGPVPSGELIFLGNLTQWCQAALQFPADLTAFAKQQDLHSLRFP